MKREKVESNSKLSKLKSFLHLGSKPEETSKGVKTLDANESKVLPIAVILALIAGFVLSKNYFGVIILSFLSAVIFYPLYLRINRHVKKPASAASLTFMITLLVVIIPLVLVVVLTVSEVNDMLSQLQQATADINLTDLSNQLLDTLNSLLNALTGGSVQVSSSDLKTFFVDVSATIANSVLQLITSSFSGIAGFVTEFFLYLYLFTAMLNNADYLKEIFRKLNPLGREVSDVYMSQANDMTKGAVVGQLVIAVCQGVVGAASLYFVGIDYFFFFTLILSFLSIVPLGGGILVIPMGVLMVLTGNIWQGIFVLLTHFLITVNIDNVLRPKLVPKSVRLNPALMLLAVFGALGIFGFLGIVVGPIIMILVVTTIKIYLQFVDSKK